MIELKNDRLVFSFPEVHANAVLEIAFQRTLRIPDDGKDHALPPSLGCFPVRHVDDHAAKLPEAWKTRGGVMLPMYETEAMWLSFSSPNQYPFAVKIATGKINALTGETWKEGLHQGPQDYMVVPGQPWIDGYVVEQGVIRQFVAMPLGEGYSVEEQLTGKAEHGGLQIQVFPLKVEHYTPPAPVRLRSRSMMEGVLTTSSMQGGQYYASSASISNSIPRGLESTTTYCANVQSTPTAAMPTLSADMGIGAGGRMRQAIYMDPHGLSKWDLAHSSRCFVHMMNAMVWRAVTGEEPPRVPQTAAEYTQKGGAWFDYQSGSLTELPAQDKLKGVKSILEMGKLKKTSPLPENESVDPKTVVKLGAKRSPNEVREGNF